jgi:asparagine synthase (glutamine-hydrolysing)
MLTTLPNDMLTKTDVATMAHHLEGRSPWLDKSIIDFACALPFDLKMRRLQTKYILRSIAREVLPRAITSRRKQGFSLPVDSWVSRNRDFVVGAIESSRDEMEEFIDCQYVERLLEDHFVQRRRNGRKIWLIVIFAIWLRVSRRATPCRIPSIVTKV